MATLFTRAERAYAEALILSAGGTLPPVPTPPAVLPASPVAKAARLLTFGLIGGALVARIAGADALATGLTLLLIVVSTVLLAGGSIGPVARATGLLPLPVGTAAFRAVSLALIAAGLLALPLLLPVLAVVFGFRLLVRMRRSLMTTVDRSARELELARIRGGATPRIYGLIDERHGGDARRLEIYGDEVARIRASGR
jgi:hypothetical protein